MCKTLRGLSSACWCRWTVDSISKLPPRIQSPTPWTASEIATLDLADLLALCVGISSFFGRGRSARRCRPDVDLGRRPGLADIAVVFGWPPHEYLADQTYRRIAPGGDAQPVAQSRIAAKSMLPAGGV